MGIGRRIGAVVGIAAIAVLATPAPASAVAITVPSSADLGSVPSGTTSFSARLGTVTATDSGTLLLLPSFTASVTATNFTTGAGSAAETIPKASISYWSGPVTASTGSQTAVPGQLTALQAVTLSQSRTAFSSSGLVLEITTSWNPTIVINIPAAAIAGTYTATITHSVA